jgi:glycyl-tRNA synthetase alpha subunit
MALQSVSVTSSEDMKNNMEDKVQTYFQKLHTIEIDGVSIEVTLDISEMVIPEFIHIQKGDCVLVIDYLFIVAEDKNSYKYSEVSQTRSSFMITTNIKSTKKVKELLAYYENLDERVLEDCDIDTVESLCKKGKIIFKETPDLSRKLIDNLRH